tara:strand:+ start:667 stop:1914 length:1248 start_codon:yes stop_codon:yes gene_type:complete
MDNIRKVYENNTNKILGEDRDYFKSFRESLLNNINLDKSIIKNNESIKFLDPNIFNNLSYKIDDYKHKSSYLNNDEIESSIIIKNGLDFDLVNINREKIFFNLLYSDINLLIDNIEKSKDKFHDDYVEKINSIFLNSGFNFTLKENNNSKIFLIHKNDKSNETFYTKNFFNIQKNSKLILIEKFNDEIPSNSNIINFFNLEEGSELIHLVIQNNCKDSSLQFTSYSNCEKDSKLNQLIFNCNDSSSRNHHYVSLIGESSQANLKGLFFGKNNQIIDNKTVINHLNLASSSNQTYKGILTDKSSASYLSKTFVDKIAQKTDGYQLSKGILLSNDAIFFSKPELKIYADDVKCSHGSTIGPFNKDEIFYLQSRGLSEKKARTLLIGSFCQDFIKSSYEGVYIDEVKKIIDNWLENNA